MISQPTVLHGFHIPEPATAPTLAPSSAGGSLTNGTYLYAISYSSSFGETNIGISSNITLAGNTSVLLTNIPVSGEIQVVSRNIYRTTVGGTDFKYVTTLNDNVISSYLDTMSDASLGKDPTILSTADQTFENIGTSYFNGLIKAVVNEATASGTPTPPATSNIEVNGNFLKLTYTNMTTGIGDNTVSIITNNKVSANSLIHATIQSYTGTLFTNGYPVIMIDDVIDGSFKINISNLNSLAELDGTIVVYCSIIN
jgi:hypothetical protein